MRVRCRGWRKRRVGWPDGTSSFHCVYPLPVLLAVRRPRRRYFFTFVPLNLVHFASATCYHLQPPSSSRQLAFSHSITVPTYTRTRCPRLKFFFLLFQCLVWYLFRICLFILFAKFHHTNSGFRRCTELAHNTRSRRTIGDNAKFHVALGLRFV